MKRLSDMTGLSNDAFAPYYERYIRLAPAGKPADILKEQQQQLIHFLNNLDETKADYRYAAEKWSIKEIAGHLIDVERIFCYRALCFARNDKTALPGFDEDEYVKAAQFDKRSWTDLIDEFTIVRQSSIALFSRFNAGEWRRRGTANGVRLPVLDIPSIIAGHARHHQQIIEQRYLVS
jgi:hypothetical protein